MSKFIRLISSFKNGLISPRLRGTLAEPQDYSSAEILDNFLIDRVGAAKKRPGLLHKAAVDRGPSDTIAHFEFDLMGTSYLIKFNQSLVFNAVDGAYTSTFCTVHNQGNYLSEAVKVFSKDYKASATNIGPMALWNGRHATDGNYLSDGLENYLGKYVTVSHAAKISDRTVVFTTKEGFSFLLSLFDYYSATSNSTVRQFYLYPYFVSAVALQKTLGKNVGSAVSCPIVPSNFPFNPINTDTSLVPTFGLWISSGNNQTGSSPTSGVVTKSNERMSWAMTVPRSMVYVNGTKIGLEGRFISIPSADATKDVVFFITEEFSETPTTLDYNCIQVIGGVPATGTAGSLWKISTWGDTNHPRTVGWCFGRLIYGNVPNVPAQWWASAAHPINIFYFQGFMENRLLQDANSDFSGINYQGASSPSAEDIYRFGFTNLVPSLGEIQWISSRRRIHFGTSKGECQLSIENGTYNHTSYEQLITGTNKSEHIQQSEGDRKIFYVSNYGKDIRAISTEDKDYESVDKLLTIPLEGLGIKFKKIQWIEDLFCILCLTEDDRLFALSVHSDTDIRAVSELKFHAPVADFAGTFIILKDQYYNGVSLVDSFTTYHLLPDISPGTIEVPYIHADNYDVYTTIPTFDASRFGPYPVYIYFKGVLTYIDDASTLTTLSSLPFDYTEVSETYPAYVFSNLFKARLKTPPIAEGQNFGSSVGNIHRVDRISVMIDNSGPFRYGYSEDNTMPSEGVGTNTTKIVNIDFPSSPDVEQCVYIESEDPTPLNISGISLRGVSYSGE